MKTRILFITVFLLTASYGFGQAPGVQWDKTLGGGWSDYASSILQTTDGGYIVAGSSYSGKQSGTTYREADFLIVKMDEFGYVQWERYYGDISDDDEAYDIRQTTDGGYVVAGSQGYLGSYWILKLDPAGDIQWERSYGGKGSDYAHSIRQTADGGYIVAGKSDSKDGEVTGNHGNYDYWVIKLDALGNIQWQNSYGGSGQDVPYAVRQTSDRGYIIAGLSKSNDGDVTGNHGDFDYWIVRLDSLSKIIWQRSYGGKKGDYPSCIEETYDKGFIVAGFTESQDGDVTFNHGIHDYWVLKLTSSGEIQWQKTYGGSGQDLGSAIRQTTDGGYIVAGLADSENGDVTGNHGVYDCWVVKLNDTGAIQWQKCYGGNGPDDAVDIQLTTDGGYILAATITASSGGDLSKASGNPDYWIAKLHTLPAGITQEVPGDSVVAYPNPAGDAITIRTDNIPLGTTYTLTDQTGRIVSEGILSSPSTTISLEKTVPGFYLLRVNDFPRTTIKVIKK